METQTLTSPVDTKAPAWPQPDVPEAEVAPHHTEERRQWLSEVASRRIRWQEDAFEWIEGDEGAIDAFRRLLIRLDRYQDLYRVRRLCRAGGTYRNSARGLAAIAHHYRRWIRPPEFWTHTAQQDGHP